MDTFLTSIQEDILREIGNIGAGNAATSLSQLLRKKIDMEVPSIRIVALNELIEQIGGPEQIIAATVFRVEGDAPGTVYFIMALKEAENLVHEILQDDIAIFDPETMRQNEMAISVLKEIGNILTGAYLSALSDFTRLDMRPSIPYLGIDMAGAVIVDGLLELSHVIDYALIIDTKISSHEPTNGIKGQFFFIPDADSFNKLFTSLGINEYE
ncbi:chemotaxis protein CheC [Cerasibacillus quisquiliarum]|uniref:CheY-P phosphatase CheC n=1 Tax=Cerasibacillus quisquiliarum TaxID=227865 RepID=A0A511UV27_9BACI|nr:chemotaxis protein CheC [Cerasibacillus quisquiliarum]MBB5145879.1 chemotaxis protein CheC [Cerasibacillus quisquiliarum]GEN30450.1 CheY-P phosphatase CheC [Cerasibacillus quisquiliarum]